MKKFVLALALLTSNMLPSLAAGDYPPAVKEKNLYAEHDIRGKAAPKLEVKEWLTGSAPDTANKVVLIDFWATWCPPCRELVSELNDYQKKFSKDLVVIGISDESADTIRNFMKNHEMKYNVAIDPSAKMKEKIGVKGIPHVLVISPDNIVRWQGFPQSDEDELTEEKIAQIIKASKTN